MTDDWKKSRIFPLVPDDTPRRYSLTYVKKYQKGKDESASFLIQSVGMDFGFGCEEPISHLGGQMDFQI